MTQLRTAAILGGCAATRLRPISDTVPKAMVRLRGRPILEWIVEWVRLNDVDRLVVGVAYKKEQIIRYFRDGSRYGVHIEYSIHTVEGGTGQGLKRVHILRLILESRTNSGFARVITSGLSVL